MSEMVKKWKIAPFVDVSENPLGNPPSTPQWVRIRKSTAFDLSMQPETKEYDYICDESPTVEIDKYKPQINQSLTMYKGEADYEFFFNKFYTMAVGSDAKTNVLIVFFQEALDEGALHTVFKAWKAQCVVGINSLNSVDSTLSFDVIFGGTVEKGFVKIEDGAPVFSEGAYTAPSVLPVQPEESGAEEEPAENGGGE